MLESFCMRKKSTCHEARVSLPHTMPCTLYSQICEHGTVISCMMLGTQPGPKL